MAAKPLDDAKIMDVARPGKTKPVSTSRPVITTHPTLPKSEEPEAGSQAASTAESAPESHDEKMSAPSAARKVITPISVDVKPEEDGDGAVTTDEKSGDEPAADAKSEEKTDDQPHSSDAAGVDALAESATDKKAESKATEEQEKREAAIQELVTSKKYNVPLAHDSTRKKGSKAPLIILLVLLIVAAAGYAAVDEGLVDPGFDVPYHILKK